MARLDTERQKELEPLRMARAIEKIDSLGLTKVYVDAAEVRFMYKDKVISFFPYSGWHSGKGITPGRGFDKLFKQLK